MSNVDMVDGALGTLDLTLSKRDMIGFAPRVFCTEGAREMLVRARPERVKTKLSIARRMGCL